MFKIVNTFKNPADPQNAQRGQPSAGVGQTNPARKAPGEYPWYAKIHYMGTDAWDGQGEEYNSPEFPVDAQRGQPAATGPGQARPRGSVVHTPMDGTTSYRETRNFSRGMERFAVSTPILQQNANPGSYVPFRPSVVPKYPLGQYVNNTIFWTNQIIPTTIPLAGLQTEEAIDALLSTFHVYGKAQAI